LSTGGEISTKWIFGDNTILTSNATGFLEGAKLKIAKRERFGGAAATIKIYKFNTTNNA